MTERPDQQDPKPFWGWRVVVAGACAQLVSGGFVQHAYTHYAVLLREEFGWGTTLIAAGFALNRVESGLLGPLQGAMLDRFGPRRVMQVGALFLGVGLYLFSTMNSAVEFFAYYFLVAVGASLAGFMTVVTSVVGWFQRRRSFALSLAQAGFPLGGILVPAIVFGLENYGWRTTARLSAVAASVAILAASRFMYRSPADVGQEIDGGEGAKTAPNSSRAQGRLAATPATAQDFTLAEAVRTRAFWCLNLGHATALLVVGSTMTHLAPYLTEQLGFTLAMAGWVSSALLLLQLGGQLLGGRLGDVYNKQVLVILAMMGHVAGMLLFTFARAPWMIWAFVPLHGLAWGVRGPLMQAMRADYFGASSFGSIMGWSSMIMMLGTMSGPLIVGIIRDQTGTFTPGFATVTALASVAAVFFAFATPPTHPGGPTTDVDDPGGRDPTLRASDPGDDAGAALASS